MKQKTLPFKIDYALITFIIVLLLPFVFFREIALLVIVGLVVVLFGRSNPIYGDLKIEIHSALMLAFGFVHGVWPAVYIAFGSALFANKIGKRIGGAQWPHFVLLDSIYMSIIALIATKLSLLFLYNYGFWIVAAGTIITRLVRVFFFMDPKSRALMLVTVSILFNYIIIENLLPTFIELLR